MVFLVFFKIHVLWLFQAYGEHYSPNWRISKSYYCCAQHESCGILTFPMSWSKHVHGELFTSKKNYDWLIQSAEHLKKRKKLHHIYKSTHRECWHLHTTVCAYSHIPAPRENEESKYCVGGRMSKFPRLFKKHFLPVLLHTAVPGLIGVRDQTTSCVSG